MGNIKKKHHSLIFSSRENASLLPWFLNKNLNIKCIHFNWTCTRQYLQQTVLIIESFCTHLLAHESAMPKLSFRNNTDIKQNKVSLTLCVVNVLNIQGWSYIWISYLFENIGKYFEKNNCVQISCKITLAL